jgi:hypothetical protein
MKKKIVPECLNHSYTDDTPVFGNRREWEVDEGGKLWPCCVWIQGWKQILKQYPDEKLEELLKSDPNFNDLGKYTWEEIMENPIYKSYINFEGWNSDNPSPVCVYECGRSGRAHQDHTPIENEE